jgi:hypothetical protein
MSNTPLNVPVDEVMKAMGSRFATRIANLEMECAQLQVALDTSLSEIATLRKVIDVEATSLANKEVAVNEAQEAVRTDSR